MIASHSPLSGCVDCFGISVDGDVPLAEFVEAFLTSPAFLPERAALALIGKGSTREDARRLATGASDRFAAWTVERRGIDQVLLRDFLGHTRMCLMVEPCEAGGTRVYFGTRIEPGKMRPATGRKWATAIRTLAPLHGFYSRCLLASAVRNLR